MCGKTNVMFQKEFEENGFTVEGSYSDVTGTTISPKSLKIAIVANKSSAF